MKLTTLPFSRIWAIDFEFIPSNGNLPVPICCCGKELITGEVRKVWLEGNRVENPPYDIDESSLVIVYFGSSAEWLCSLTLGWNLPVNSIDLYAEYRTLTNGLPVERGLLSACAYYGIPTIAGVEKEAWRQRIIRGAPYTQSERGGILAYCMNDVEVTARLFKAMLSEISLEHALFRGRYMQTVGRMEYVGVPIDIHTLQRLDRHWETVKRKLIETVDKDFGFYEGTTFKAVNFTDYLKNHNIPWETTTTGLPKLRDGYFKEKIKLHPELAPIRDLRHILSQLKLHEFEVGTDGRNRTLLSPFGAKTGRNTPSTSKFIFGAPKWLRSLVQPPPGKVLCYLDYSQQEYGIAAALSNDEIMWQTYERGDPYIEFAILAGAAPPGATKRSYGAVRSLFKTCVLALQYHQGARSLAERIELPEIYARTLIDHHKRIFHKFWEWQKGMLIGAKFNGMIQTVYGWRLLITIDTSKKERTVFNFPMQANGAEILRVACIMLSEAGITVCCPIHDALMIECPEAVADESIQKAKQLMELAAENVVGRPIRVETQIVRYPDRFRDEHAGDTWDTVMNILEEIEAKESISWEEK